ncbi:pyridoxal phosphate-dependent decarboxylase family protein [Timonella sp. A28]|uniref:pyridoxal phosphate-dependent decarboxylase family protein n=1 Tax=Timonella sp. A28 TaxID=3442640 RepID=UPI003EBE92EA
MPTQSEESDAPHSQTAVAHLSTRSQEILARIQAFRAFDAPTHGGRVLSYVYDTGIEEIDELAAHAAKIVQPINGLDPTAFPSVAIMERDLLGFVRTALNGGEDVFGNVTTGGTESCLLAVKTARDVWRKGKTSHAIGRIVAPRTVHAAFHKAAEYFDLILDLVDVDPTTGEVSPQDIIDRLGDDVAVVVLSAPNYPYAQLDPIEVVAQETLTRGIPLHVDACIGGLALPWWEDLDQAWDFRVPGVTSISADLHKYGYAPKGVSVLLQRGADRHRAQYFAVTQWPGYPVVNPTLLGSKSAGPIASAWAIVQFLGEEGFAELVRRTQQATRTLIEQLGAIEGLRIQGTPTGPLFALVEDENVPAERRVNPHLLVDQVRTFGWTLQSQPGLIQDNGSSLPQSAHLTLTPVIADKVDDIITAVKAAADAVRGKPGHLRSVQIRQDIETVVAALGQYGVAENGAGIDALPVEAIHMILKSMGIDPANGELPGELAELMAYAQLMPSPIAQRLLTEVLALVVTPTAAQ